MKYTKTKGRHSFDSSSQNIEMSTPHIPQHATVFLFLSLQGLLGTQQYLPCPNHPPLITSNSLLSDLAALLPSIQLLELLVPLTFTPDDPDGPVL